MADWQPIETAPKDRHIQVFPGIWTGVTVSVAKWDANEHAKKPRPYWRRLDAHHVVTSRGTSPTHWMPLPEPPK